MANVFQLSAYTPQILKIAEVCECSREEALQKFIENLATMKEHHKGASDLNYHELGQQWNKLLSRDKVAQKADAQARLAKYARSGGKI